MRVFICGSLLAAPTVAICLSNNASRHRQIDLYYAVRGLKSEYSIIDSHQRDVNEVHRKGERLFFANERSACYPASDKNRVWSQFS
jgi:hypothetical protein